jgi:hypothetical protein
VYEEPLYVSKELAGLLQPSSAKSSLVSSPLLAASRITALIRGFWQLLLTCITVVPFFVGWI